jgi:hypothetical protein
MEVAVSGRISRERMVRRDARSKKWQQFRLFMSNPALPAMGIIFNEVCNGAGVPSMKVDQLFFSKRQRVHGKHFPGARFSWRCVKRWGAPR